MRCIMSRSVCACVCARGWMWQLSCTARARVCVCAVSSAMHGSSVCGAPWLVRATPPQHTHTHAHIHTHTHTPQQQQQRPDAHTFAQRGVDVLVPQPKALDGRLRHHKDVVHRLSRAHVAPVASKKEQAVWRGARGCGLVAVAGWALRVWQARHSPRLRHCAPGVPPDSTRAHARTYTRARAHAPRDEADVHVAGARCLPAVRCELGERAPLPEGVARDVDAPWFVDEGLEHRIPRLGHRGVVLARDDDEACRSGGRIVASRGVLAGAAPGALAQHQETSLATMAAAHVPAHTLQARTRTHTRTHTHTHTHTRTRTRTRTHAPTHTHTHAAHAHAHAHARSTHQRSPEGTPAGA
jgi:hypothetical protein